MKTNFYFCISALCLLLKLPSYAQLGPRIDVGQDRLTEPTGSEQIYTVPFFIHNTRPNVVYTVTVEDRLEGSANSPHDYELVDNATSTPTVTRTITLPSVVNGQFMLRIKHDTLSHHNRTIVLQLRALSSTADTMLFLKKVITIMAPSGPSTSEGGAEPTVFKIDSLHSSLKIFTGSNFDFFGEQTFKKFAGDFEVHLPDLCAVNNNRIRFGLNLGITYYHYFRADTANGNFHNENVLGKPEAPFVSGQTRYGSNIYALNTSTDLQNWGYHSQLLISWGKQLLTKNGLRTYLTLHGEALASTATTTFDKRLIRTDSITYRSGDRTVFQRGGLMPTERTTQSWDGYFGIGPTFYYEQTKLLEASGQIILGATSYNPKRVDALESIGGTSSFLLNRKTEFSTWTIFYLARVRVTEHVTKLNGTAGVEVRGIFPQYNPFIAAYLGIQIDIAKFFH